MTRKTNRLLSVVSIVVLSVMLFPNLVQATTTTVASESSNVAIISTSRGNNIPNIHLSLYTLEKGYPKHSAGELSTGSSGVANLQLPDGEYIVEAYSQGESGYNGYKTFTIDHNRQNNYYIIKVEMKQNRDHSNSINLTPTLAGMMPLENDTTPVTVEFALSGKVGEQAVPIFAKNQALRDKDKITPVDLSKLDPLVKDLLVKREQQILAWYNQENNQMKLQQTGINGVSPQSVGSRVYLSLWDYGIVKTEQTNELWHPVAVIDSEPGLTHSFSLSLYASSSKSFQLSSNVQIIGVAANVAYGVSYSASFAITFAPITCFGGQVNTYRSSFRHVYQEGDLYHYYLFLGWWHVGDFKREYVDTWYQASYERVSYGQMDEVRSNYLGEWRSSTWADMTMTNGVSTSWAGGIGVTVAKGDVFGAGAQISLTYDYNFGTTAVHHFDYTMPGPDYYVKFYSGRAFEINTFQWHPGPWV